MKTNAAGVTTVYVAEGQVVSDALHPDVVLVGPGSDEEVEPSPGNSSGASESKTDKSERPSSSSPSSPAPTTGLLSSTEKASDAAPTTVGSTQGTTSQRSTEGSDKK
jgi:hypothetical protein